MVVYRQCQLHLPRNVVSISVCDDGGGDDVGNRSGALCAAPVWGATGALPAALLPPLLQRRRSHGDRGERGHRIMTPRGGEEGE